MTPIDRAIKHIDDKIAVLTLAKQELVAARDDQPAEPTAPPKVRKTRQRRIGLSGAQPPASDANHGQAQL